MSFWNKPTEAAKNAVIAPTIKIILKANWDCSKRGEHRIKRYTPAVTIVAACIRAETGVGPSLEMELASRQYPLKEPYVQITLHTAQSISALFKPQSINTAFK